MAGANLYEFSPQLHQRPGAYQIAGANIFEIDCESFR